MEHGNGKRRKIRPWESPCPSSQSSVDIIPHPLSLFPKPRDHLTSLWVSKRRYFILGKNEQAYPLLPAGQQPVEGKIEPSNEIAREPREGHRGILLDDGDEKNGVSPRRIWRGLLCDEIQQPYKSRGNNLCITALPPSSDNDRYIMLRADRFKHHLNLEEKLAMDHRTIQRQATWYYAGSSMSTREASPMLKIVVDKICQEEMNKATTRHIHLLQTRPSIKATYLHRDVQAHHLHQIRRLPLAKNIRFASLYNIRDQIEADVSARESILMAHEESLTRQAYRYIDAKERQVDYELYYDLVHGFKFGYLSVELFNQSNRPGRLYYDTMSKSATKFQRMWRRCWPIRRRRKGRGACLFQQIWRAYIARKRWRPIVLMRVKCGYRAQLIYRFKRWRSYKRALVGVRKGFQRSIRRLQLEVFDAWTSYLQSKGVKRKIKVNKMRSKVYRHLFRIVYAAWRKYTADCKRIRCNFIRMYKNPYLSFWVQYVRLVKYERQEINLAWNCQRLGRGMLVRCKFRLMKRRIEFVKSCLRRIIDRRRFKGQLKAFYERLVMDHAMEKRDKYIQGLIAEEEVRLEALHAHLRLVEDKARRNSWLSEDDVKFIVVAAKHDFEVSRPPPFRSPNPSLLQTFVVPEHLEQSLEPEQGIFYQLLLNKEDVVAVYQFIGRTYGVSEKLWLLNFWFAVENLRPMVTTDWMSRRFKARVLQIIHRYLTNERSPNPVPYRLYVSKTGTFVLDRLSKLSILTGTARKNATYGAALSLLYHAQFEALRYLVDQVAPDFYRTDAGKKWKKELLAQRYNQWSKDEDQVVHKYKQILKRFAHELKVECNQRIALRNEAISNQAASAATFLLERLSELLVTEACATYAERENDMIDELLPPSVIAVEDLLINEILAEKLEIVIREVRIDALSEQGLDCLLEEYIDGAVLETYEDEVERLVEDSVDQCMDDLVEEFVGDIFVDTAQRVAALKIQCAFRRLQGLRVARRQVAKTIIKRFDPTSGQYYYHNTLTNDVTWEKPKIVGYLFASIHAKQRILSIKSASDFTSLSDSSSSGAFTTTRLLSAKGEVNQPITDATVSLQQTTAVARIGKQTRRPSLSRQKGV